MDRLRAMQAFVRAAELGSLSAAARALHTTQPTISKLVAGLENSLGVRLLERSTARVLTTEEGARFLASAKELLEGYEDAVEDLRGRIQQPKGLVRISAPVALGMLRLNGLMLQALEVFPLLEIELALEDRYVDPVEERIDLAVRIGGALPPDLVARPLGVWPRYLVASPDYLARCGRPRQLQDLQRHNYLRYAGAPEQLVLSGPRGTVSVELAARYRINSAVAMLEAVCAGAGIALQPSWMVDELLKQGTLVRLLPQWTGPSQVAHLLHTSKRRQPMRIQAMVDFLLAQLHGPGR